MREHVFTDSKVLPIIDADDRVVVLHVESCQCEFIHSAQFTAGEWVPIGIEQNRHVVAST